jgi:hypothetical protein
MNFCLTAGIAALGGLLFGYDTRVISRALLFIRQSPPCRVWWPAGAAVAGGRSDRLGWHKVILAARLRSSAFRPMPIDRPASPGLSLNE